MLMNQKKPKPHEAPSSINRDFSYNLRPAPRFLLIKLRNGNFDSISPFLIDRVLSQAIGKPKAVSKTRDGLLVETQNSEQSSQLLKLRHFEENAITVEPHKTLNTCKGQITSRDLLICSEQEILENLASQGVIHVKRRTTMMNGTRTDTHSLILTFNTPELPTRVKAGYLSLPVTLWIPPPLRCFNCQLFGHLSSACSNPAMCVCGNPPHGTAACPEEQNCLNCNGQHSARSNKCPVYKTEMAIQRLKVTEHLSCPEARRRITENSRSFPTTSYAAAASSPNTSHNGFNIKDLVAALVPELIRALGLAPTSQEPVSTQDPSTSTCSHAPILENAIPTSVLSHIAYTRPKSTEQARQEQFNASQVVAWFDKQPTRTKLKRSKSNVASSATSIASTGDEQKNDSGSSSESRPIKKKSLEEPKINNKSDTNSEIDDEESLFDPGTEKLPNHRKTKKKNPDKRDPDRSRKET